MVSSKNRMLSWTLLRPLSPPGTQMPGNIKPGTQILGTIKPAFAPVSVLANSKNFHICYVCK